MQEHHLSIQGHQLVALEYNPHLNTIPVIFIHGITSNPYFWKDVQIPLVNQQFHWFSLALPGHYPATLPVNFTSDQLTSDMMSSVMSDAIRQLTKGQPCIIVGYSTGGYAGLCVAQHAPELVEGLILVDGFAEGTWHGMLRPAQLITALGKTVFSVYFRSLLITRPYFRFSFKLLGNDRKAIEHYPNFMAIADASYDMGLKINPREIYHYFKVMPQTDIRAQLPQIQHKTHIIHGTKDGIILPAHAEEMQKLLPHASLTWLDGSGHLPMFERPQAYEKALSAALAPYLKG